MSFIAAVLLTAVHGTELSTLDQPPSPVSAPQDCWGGWPLFQTVEELDADPWGEYFKKLYGHEQVVQNLKYPLCIGEELWQVYDALVPNKKVPELSGKCPDEGAPEGQRYRTHNDYQPAATSFSWHPPPYRALGENVWAEVSHHKDPFGDEHYGMWLLWTPGSGIWFNTGKTIQFKEHDDGYEHFQKGNEPMCQDAVAQGYDSIQFTEHKDHVNYPCDNKAGVPYMGLEIVAVKLTGTYPCGSADGSVDYNQIRSAYKGRSKCRCDNSREVMNCGDDWGPFRLLETMRSNESVAEVADAVVV